MSYAFSSLAILSIFVLVTISFGCDILIYVEEKIIFFIMDYVPMIQFKKFFLSDFL